jgi:hypothetical protein
MLGCSDTTPRQLAVPEVMVKTGAPRQHRTAWPQALQWRALSLPGCWIAANNRTLQWGRLFVKYARGVGWSMPVNLRRRHLRFRVHRTQVPPSCVTASWLAERYFLKLSAGGLAMTGAVPVKPSRVSEISRMRARQAYQHNNIRAQAMAVTSMVRGESMKTMIRTLARKSRER